MSTLGKTVHEGIGNEVDDQSVRRRHGTVPPRKKPLCRSPRRLVDWLNPDGQKKVHSLVDKVYQPKNLRAAWEKVKANRGSGVVDGNPLNRRMRTRM
jgi:hypothetical protein